MVRSKAEAPHFYIQMDVSTDALREVRDQVNRDAGDKRPRLTYTHLMLKAAALALERHPHGERDLPRPKRTTSRSTTRSTSGSRSTCRTSWSRRP